ncbi:MAG: serine/threonine protein kinase [Polyangiaceae bacterium]|nr:serine/threonine protein kinase [Polyangiaceae bacterium]
MPARSDRPRSDQHRQEPEVPDISVEALKYHPGDVVAEKYRLEELMGQGAMGAVWRARNLALDVDVALKLIHGELVSPESVERLEREAHAAARLEHPSAVRVFDLGKSELGDPFIVMELLRGESLYDLLDRRKTLAPEEAVPLLLPIVSALAAAHGKGIVHRDLKPDNIVLVEQESGVIPKVVDFGIAMVSSPRYERRSTTAGTILGSPDYMSPEQASGDVEQIGPASDVWSLAVVLYETIAGRPPFEAPHPLALLRAIIETDPRTLLGLGVADAKLSAVVDRALTKDLARRFPDMRSFGKALAEWAMSVGIDTDATGASLQAVWAQSSRTSLASFNTEREARISRTSAPRVFTPNHAVWTPTKSPPRGRRIAAAVAGIVAIVAAAFGAVWFFRGKHPASASGARSDATAAPVASPTVNERAEMSAAPASNVPAEATATTPTALASATVASSAPSIATDVAPRATDVRSCVARLFPPDAFEKDASLDALCIETDPRRGAALLRGEIAKHGLVARRTTDPMRIWAQLSWYEMATFALARGRCCEASKLPDFVVPPSVGTCETLAPALEGIEHAARGERDKDTAIAAFRSVAVCIERSHRLNTNLPSPYSYRDPPPGGAETVFRAMLDRAAPAP